MKFFIYRRLQTATVSPTYYVECNKTLFLCLNRNCQTKITICVYSKTELGIYNRFI